MSISFHYEDAFTEHSLKDKTMVGSSCLFILLFLYQKVYIPAASLVVMSWVPFWLTEEKCGTPARASIGVMTVLSMLTICSNVKNVGGAVS